MDAPTKPLRPALLALAAAALVGSALVSLAPARPAPDGPAPRPKSQYMTREADPDALAATLNEMDGEGYDLVQVVPVWKVESANGESSLVPKAYQIVARKTLDR